MNKEQAIKEAKEMKCDGICHCPNPEPIEVYGIKSNSEKVMKAKLNSCSRCGCPIPSADCINSTDNQPVVNSPPGSTTARRHAHKLKGGKKK